MSTEVFEIRIRLIVGVNVETVKVEPKKTPGPNFSGITVVEPETVIEDGSNSGDNIVSF